jgi:hypothetical protein
MRGLALALMVLPSLALADPSPKDQQKARDLVKQAIAKSQAGEHEAAIELYDDAYKIIPQPLLLSNIGSEYQQIEHKEVEALGFFCKYLAADPNGTNVGFATAQAKTLYIKLGGVTDVKDEDVCKPIQKPAPLVEPKSDPTPIDTTPTPTPTTPPIAEGGTKTSPMRYVGIGVAAAGVGMFGFGVYEGLQAKSISDEITNHPMSQPWDANIKDREQEGKDAEKKQIIFMAAGGAALAAGAVMFFVFAPTSATEHVAIAPTTNGFVAFGRF